MHPKSPSVTVDPPDDVRWFGEYLNASAACGRGENESASLLTYYGVPLLLSTDDGAIALTTRDDVVAMAQRQVDGMRASDGAFLPWWCTAPEHHHAGAAHAPNHFDPRSPRRASHRRRSGGRSGQWMQSRDGNPT